MSVRGGPSGILLRCTDKRAINSGEMSTLNFNAATWSLGSGKLLLFFYQIIKGNGFICSGRYVDKHLVVLFQSLA